MKLINIFVSMALFSIGASAGVGGTIGGSSSMTIEEILADAKFTVKVPTVQFERGQSIVLVPITETCLHKNNDVLVLRTLKSHTYLRGLTLKKERIESDTVLEKLIDPENSDLVRPISVEVYSYLARFIKNLNPLFSKTYKIHDCPTEKVIN